MGGKWTHFRLKRALVGGIAAFVGLKMPFSCQHRNILSQHKDLLGRKKVLFYLKRALSDRQRALPGQYKADEGPCRQKEGLCWPIGSLVGLKGSFSG